MTDILMKKLKQLLCLVTLLLLSCSSVLASDDLKFEDWARGKATVAVPKAQETVEPLNFDFDRERELYYYEYLVDSERLSGWSPDLFKKAHEETSDHVLFSLEKLSSPLPSLQSQRRLENQYLVDSGEERVLGEDTRNKAQNPLDYPWNMSGKMVMHYRTAMGKVRAYIGTGILVQESHVLTAGHCLYDQTFGFPEVVEFMPGRRQGSTPRKASATQLIVHPDYYRSTRNSYADIGMFLVDHPLGRDLAYAALYPLPDDKYPRWGTIAGFPGDRDAGKNMYYASNEVNIDTGDNRRLVYQIDTYGGQSGSGITFKHQDLRVCIGIHTTGNTYENSGVRINGEKHKKIGSWIAKLNS